MEQRTIGCCAALLLVLVAPPLARPAAGQSLYSPGLSQEQAAQLTGFWRYQNRTQGTFCLFGVVWDDIMAEAAAKGADAINATEILADALAATSFFIEGGILIPAVDAATGVFAGYFITEDIIPPRPDRPPFPLVSRLVGKARPGQDPNWMTWQGWYGNTSSLLQGVVQAGEDGQLVMDFLSSGGLAVKQSLPTDNQHACEYYLAKEEGASVEEMLAGLAAKLPASLDGGI
ncbi:succinylglutamate desuccinylase [Chlorella sorokiniana]|uniref:Succinylglutamate desuccinylase n=1 Tax=Chlorella sorokiniana TaxID=3076 RepID=A0A2P6U3Y9_CHLSO|nr:succinylglutamate desuccinylase [Chlorella sorokiniana]|eukprot:PRW61040.1 succinylglutamate desuccinylase [Chlorella sorokiniana]